MFYNYCISITQLKHLKYIEIYMKILKIFEEKLRYKNYKIICFLFIIFS